LDELIQVEAELATLLEQLENVQVLSSQHAMVPNRYLPKREIVTAIEPVPAKHDLSGSGVKFNSSFSHRIFARRCRGFVYAVCRPVP
jgi:hypothetical protein